MRGMRETIKRVVIIIAAATAAGSLGGCGKSDDAKGGPGPAASSAGPAGGPFRLGEGLEHDVCGIGISVKFIPATNASSKFDYAVVYGGPINKVPDKVQNHTGSDPLPDNAAHAVAGTTITVYGKKFTVDAVDNATSSVQLRALC
jgi:hypothetical protein